MYAYVVCIQCSLRVQRLTHASDWSLLSLALDIALKAAGFISQPANNILARKSTVPQTKSGCGMVLKHQLNLFTQSYNVSPHNQPQPSQGEEGFGRVANFKLLPRPTRSVLFMDCIRRHDSLFSACQHLIT